MTRNIWFLLGFTALVAAPAALAAESQPTPSAVAQATVAQDPKALAPRQEGDDMVMGADKAPVTIIEYASLTCPHCAHFNETTFPQLKAQYIDKGLVKYIYRDFPLDRMALTASEIARCAGPERYFGFIDAIFRQQASWTSGGNANEITENLKRLARLGGLSTPAADACLNDKALQDKILAQSLQGEKEFKVDSTPTLIINGEKHPGALTIDELSAIINPLTKKS
ncbi:MAG TPA: DsbA family protein [Caulobacteraceae bacterium]|nr:DsbA family protein [Alphaproteobacteria bacterium]HVN01123.1 DsbA family protein [Caulobacteraceae bacterium]